MTENANPRRRVVTWEDPHIGAQAAKGMTGIDYLRAILAREAPTPPIALLLGFELREIEAGRAVFTGNAGEHLYNPIGMVHGGYAATLCDSAMGCAVQSMLPAGEGYTTLELKVNLIRAITHDSGEVRCTGRLVHLGRTSAVAEAQLHDAKGRLCAHATSTCLILRPEAGGNT